MSETTSFNPSDEYINALLCKVAYEGVSVGDSFLDLDTSEFSETERNFLQSNFEVVDSSSDFLSGFKACWIRNKETNEVVYAIAGTDDLPGGLFDYGDDYDICKKGIATEQFIEAYNYYMRVANAQGSVINQIVEGKPESGAYLRIPVSDNEYKYYTVEEVVNSHEGTEYSNISLTGHSLGGHLAGLIGMITGNQTTIFNAPSFFKDPAGNYSIQYVFINEDGTETTETLTSDYLGFVEKFFGSDLNQNSITHIYNSNNVNIIANLGWEWEHNKGVDCLNQAPGLLEAHGISSLCDAYRTYLIINNFITESNLFFENNTGTDSKNAFENIYKLYCLENNLAFTPISYNTIEFQENYLDPLEAWLKQKETDNIGIMSDSFNGTSSPADVNGTGGADIIYTGGGNDTTNAGAGADTVYSGDFYNENAKEYTKNVNLGAGSDTYYGLNGSDIVNGGTSVDGTGDTNNIFLGGGNDIYHGGNGADIVDGGTGNTGGIFETTTRSVSSTTSDLMRDSTDNKNKIYLGGGNDVYQGTIGRDLVYGGTGNNQIHLGRDSISDAFYSSAGAGETDTIWDFAKEDYVVITSGILSHENVGNDLHIHAKNGSTVIIKNFTLAEDEELPQSIIDDTRILLDTRIEDTLREPLLRSKVHAESQASPLILDLDGNGISTVGVNHNIYFDHDGNGFAENTGWVGQGDGLLVRDINGNGQIDNGSELFGDNTLLSDGTKASNGFEALKDLDSNQDNVFDVNDTAFNEVKVWKDTNLDGKVNDGELLSLAEAGITSINLDYQSLGQGPDENGNDHKQNSNFNTSSGSGIISDVWFDTEPSKTIYERIPVPADIATLPNLQGFGNVVSLHEAMALDTTGALKDLVIAYTQETEIIARKELMKDIIFHWTGVHNVDPESRAAGSYNGGNYIKDARIIEALECFWGEKYSNRHWMGSNEENPRQQAALILIRAFDELCDAFDYALQTEVKKENIIAGIEVIYDDVTQTVNVDVSDFITNVTALYEQNPAEALKLIQENSVIIRERALHNDEIISAIRQAATTIQGNLSYYLSQFGSINVFITSGNDTIEGTDGNDYIDGLAGNDNLYGGAGDDILIGNSGNDHLVGGEGSDTYIFGTDWGHDTIDNSSTEEKGVSKDIVEFSDYAATDISISRIENDLILSTKDGNNSLKILSYFLDTGETNNTVDEIKFSDGTIWNYEYIVDVWNKSPQSVDGVTMIEGSRNDDRINGTSGDDVISGGKGNDTIYANNGNDTLYGGQGDDQLEGGAGNDTYIYNLGDGIDTIYDSGNQDTIVFGYGINLNDLKFAYVNGALQITVQDDPNQKILINSFFNGINYKIEKLKFNDGTEFPLSEVGLTLTQSDETETVYGTSFSDVIYGNKGNDTIYGNGGNDTIIGGKGNDTISGGNGNNIYVYNLGDNFDTINESGGTDKILFGEGISFNDLTFMRNGNSLTLYIKGNKSQGIQINNQFSGSYNQVETLEFADGTTFDLVNNGFTFIQKDSNETISGTSFNDIIYADAGNDNIYAYEGNNVISGGKGNDTIYAGSGNDVYRYELGDGLDIITDDNGIDKIVFGSGISLADLTFSADDDTLCIYINNDKTQGIKITDQLDDYSSNKIETIEFADGSTFNLTSDNLTLTLSDGNDYLYGPDQNITYIGNKGDDSISGGSGNDTYVWNLGDGMDSIYDEGGTDRIIFGPNISLDDISFRRNDSELFIIVNNDINQGVRIGSFFYRDYAKIETIEFSDGTTFDLTTLELTNDPVNINRVNGTDSADDFLVGTDGNDNIDGADGNDTLIGGKGNDELHGNAGHDTYVWNRGDGLDRIIESSGTDRILFGEGISLSDLTFSYDGGICIYIDGDKSQGIKIDSQSGGLGITSEPLEYLEFADGTIFSLKDNGIIYNGDNLDNYLPGTNFDDVANGYEGNDEINTGDGNDTINGGKGDDILKGGSGNDTYIYNLGDGFDKITDSSGYDKIKLGTDISIDDISFSREGNNLNIYIKNDRMQGMQIANFFSQAEYQIEVIEFADGSTFNLIKGLALTGNDDDENISGTAYNDIISGKDGKDTLTGGDGHDQLIGGQGDDKLNGGYGNDTYVYNIGDDFDTITETAGNDKIVFGANITLDRLVFKQENKDLCIYIDGDLTQGIRISSYFSNVNSKVETIEFADGTNLNIIEHIEGTEAPTFGQTLVGTSNNDTITGTEGSDIITGGTGNDTLNGKSGDDTYIYNLGDGLDTITENYGNDKILFGEGISFSDLALSKDSNDLLIYINNSTSQGIRIKNHFSNEQYRIEALEFSNGSIFDLTQNGLTFIQTKKDDNIDGTAYDDTIYGLSGNDTLRGNAGNDILVGGKGNDKLEGGAGNDTYIYNRGDGLDTIQDTSGVDKIIFGPEISQNDLSFEIDDSNVLIYLNNDRAQGIKILSQIGGQGWPVESIEFADGSVLKLTSMMSHLAYRQTDKNDTVYGSSYGETIYGNKGNDTIYTYAGDDVLIGGKGNDALYGGVGDDTYIYNLGDGFDTIEEEEYGHNKIVFGEGITQSNLSFCCENADVIIYINGDKSQGIRIKDQIDMHFGRWAIEKLEFADGSFIDLTQQGLTYELNSGDNTVYVGDTASTYISSSGNDNFLSGNSTGGGNSYVYNRGDGLDTIECEENDKIVFGEGITLNDLVFKAVGSDLHIYIGEEQNQGIIIKSHLGSPDMSHIEFADGSSFDLKNQGLTLVGNSADDKMNGTLHNDVISGNDGNDEIYANEGNDTIIGGRGNDILQGAEGDDMYIYNLGDGFDSISDKSGNDKIIFGEGISQGDVSFRREGYNLIIYLNGDISQGMRIDNYYNQSNTYKVETIEFSDGSVMDISNLDLTDEGTARQNINGTDDDDVLTGGNGDDYIYGNMGNDTLTGNKGNDDLYGGSGDDTYIWNLGDGLDTISEYNGNDKIIFGEGISLNDLTFENRYDDLYIFVKGDRTQGICISDYFYSEDNQVENLEFSDGTTFNLTNSEFTFTYSDGDDSITGTDRNDTFIGSRGNDEIEGREGDDTYIYNLGDGLDTISDYEYDYSDNTKGKNDRIKFGEGIAFSDLTFKSIGDSLHIYINGDINQGIIINRQNYDESYQIEYLEFADGSVFDLANNGLTFKQDNLANEIVGTLKDDIIYAYDGDDTIDAQDGNNVIVGGKGYDTIKGGNDNDTYIYNIGDDFDTISDSNGNDKIKFGAGITLEQLIFEISGSDLNIYIDSDKTQGIKITNQYSYNANYRIETLEFADGSLFNLSESGLTFSQNDSDENITTSNFNDIIYAKAGNDVIDAKDGNDIIYGGNGYDTLKGGNGNDTLIGGKDDDILQGGNGDDTYIYKLGDGFDSITDTGGNDKLVFEEIRANDLSVEKNGNDLIFKINNQEDSGIKISNHFSSQKIETLEFSNGSIDISQFTNADQLIQALNSFVTDTSSSMDNLSNPTEDVSDIYSLAASQDLTRKAI